MTETRVTADVLSAIGEGAVETRVTADVLSAIGEGAVETRVTADVLSAIGEGAVETHVTAFALFAIADVIRPAVAVGNSAGTSTANLITPMAYINITRVTLIVIGDQLSSSPPLDTCANEYNRFSYGSQTVYGGDSSCLGTAVIAALDTPARDLLQVHLTAEFVANAAYLNPDNYVITELSTGIQLAVRKVVMPENNLVSSRILLVMDRQLAGGEYTFSFSNLQFRDGSILPVTQVNFLARDGKANSMMNSIPKHYNMDPKGSVVRHILQALAESDDRIGSIPSLPK